MTDDEVVRWLSADEADRFKGLRSAAPARRVYRSLAETRKALVACEHEASREYGDIPVCPICRSDYNEPHAPTCIFTTMPRGKP